MAIPYTPHFGFLTLISMEPFPVTSQVIPEVEGEHISLSTILRILKSGGPLFCDDSGASYPIGVTCAMIPS